MSDIDIEVVRRRNAAWAFGAGPHTVIDDLLAEVDRLGDENKALSTHIDDQFNIITDLTRLGNAMSAAIDHRWASTAGWGPWITAAKKAWDDEVGR